ncbi:apoptosis-stimulating of p53 protein 1-like isoform X2 [Gigantopelta aegis]|uniref:apoptosis-stimulating of p53 protein 1-like isoform X2 n=1 Tax=Gigantopelta aegis TaxID=1735272 RepID=UPI001B88BAB7|nr:apoptosis-stimulating of p53 protein 1-like isoform X2 [Gigantopelta aegis]
MESRYYSAEEDWDLGTLQFINQQLEDYLKMLPGGMDLTLNELQEMAARQQQQIESQQQMLVAKEQRLKYLKHQEQRHTQLSSEQDRLRRLRDKVDTQELKLKKLRALRGQVEQHKTANGNLNSELDSVKALFNEKEKELSMAVARVEHLTKQLEEIQKGKINGINGETQSAAVAELEKLRKELVSRNKLNDEQSNKLSAQRELLFHKKDEASKMDVRIQELQQRIKKRRSQQNEHAQQNKNILNQNKYPGRPPGTNIAAVEPYVQQVIKDTTQDDLCKNAGFMKKDPKYQSLPSNTKFTGDKNSVSEPSKELNNNERTEDKQLPSGVHSDFYRRKHDLNGPKSGPSMNGPLSADSQGGKIQNGDQSAAFGQENKVSSANSQGPPKFNVTNIAKYAPRPFGSTYSTTVLAGRLPGQSLQQPVINITEEERQAGSGQSSPASSDSSQNSPNSRGNAGLSNGGQLLPSATSKQKPSPPIRNSSNQPPGSAAPAQKGPGGSSVPGKGLLKGDGPQNIPYSQPKPGQPVSASFVFSKKGVQTLVSESKMSPSNVAHSSSKDSPQNGTDSQQGDVTDGRFSFDSPVAEKPQLQAHSTPVTSSNSGSTTAVSQAGVSKGIPTYRYATKNAIMNTYMGKLGSSALQKYQANMQKLYQNANVPKVQTAEQPKQDENSLPGSSSPSENSGSYNVPTASHVSVTKDKDGAGFEQRTAFNQPSSSAQGEGEGTGTDSPTRTHTHFGLVGLPQYQHIASDKGSYKANTPKQVRRRHSDSDNEDLHKYLRGGYEKYAANQKISSGLSNYQSSAFSNSEQSENGGGSSAQSDNSQTDANSASESSKAQLSPLPSPEGVVLRKKTNLKSKKSKKVSNRVSFDPLALLLDASLEGELDLVMRTAKEVKDVSTPNDEGITALHNAICAGHYEIVHFLVEFGCDVNSPDSDGWTPLHCAASCNNLPMVRFIVEHGACIFATTYSDHETAAEKCEEDEDGYDGCSDYLYSIQEKLGILNNGEVYAVFDYKSQNKDELTVKINDNVTILRKGDEKEKEWWWAKKLDREGYVAKNLLGLYPRVLPKNMREDGKE